MSHIGQWLQSQELGQFEDVFSANSITWKLLTELTVDDLKELGLNIGQRRQFLKAVSAISNPQAEQSHPASTARAACAMAAERRQLTVMFCDLVGSTALSQQVDPETLRDLMRVYQQTCGEIIERYDGHVAQYLGDGLMTYFGWPRAHEDDAERAIRVGLEIVEAVKQVPAPQLLSVRVGIATGPVVVGETGAGDASVPKLAVGETPNLAARLQGLADADQIIIGADTRALIGGTFELADEGEHTLKGIVQPVRVWRVTGLAAMRGRFDAAHGQVDLTALVGRKEELGMLLRRWQLSQDGEGQVVLLGGEPGIGKSRLLGALCAQLDGQGARAMRFQCSPFYVNSAFWPSIQNLERALKFDRNESAESKLDKLESLIVDHYERPLDDVRFVASILSVPCDERYGELVMTPQKTKDETLRTLVDLTEAAASRQPTAMLFEDLHWADPTTLEVLDLMIDRVKGMPLLIVLTHRPEFQNRWLDHGHVTALSLSKLTRAQGAALVSQVVGGKPLPGALLEQILVKTDGVPLFVEELTQSILESGELTDKGDRYDYTGAAHRLSIPATLRDSLMARLDRFTPAKAIAQMGAAIGREFSYELISAVSRLSPIQLDEALVQLTDSGLAFRRGTPPNAFYTFKHALVRDAAYDSLLKSRRQTLHATIATVIEERFPATTSNEPEVLAHHLSEAGQAERASEYFQQAGERSLRGSASVEAIAHLDRGLAVAATMPAGKERDHRELTLLMTLGPALIAARGYAAPEVEPAYRRALALSEALGKTEEQFSALHGLWWVHLCKHHLDSARNLAEQLVEVATSAQDVAPVLAAHRSLGYTLQFIGKPKAAQKSFEQVVSLYDPVLHNAHAFLLGGADPGVAGLAMGAWSLFALGYPDQARDWSTRGLTLAQTLSHPLTEVWALTAAAIVHQFLGEPGETHAHADAAVAIAQDKGFAQYLAWAGILRAWARVELGGGTQAITDFEVYFDRPQANTDFLLEPYWRSMLAGTLAQAGRVQNGLVQVDRALAEVARREERCWESELFRIKGALLLWSTHGDETQAEACFANSLDIARTQEAKSWELRTATSLARLWRQQGKRHEAAELLAPIYNGFTEGFNTMNLKEAGALLAQLAP